MILAASRDSIRSMEVISSVSARKNSRSDERGIKTRFGLRSRNVSMYGKSGVLGEFCSLARSKSLMGPPPAGDHTCPF